MRLPYGRAGEYYSALLYMLRSKVSKRFPHTGGWGYALFNYDAATGQFLADPATADCGHACHVAVKSKDYIFHPYQKR